MMILFYSQVSVWRQTLSGVYNRDVKTTAIYKYPSKDKKKRIAEREYL